MITGENNLTPESSPFIGEAAQAFAEMLVALFDEKLLHLDDHRELKPLTNKIQ